MKLHKAEKTGPWFGGGAVGFIIFNPSDHAKPVEAPAKEEKPNESKKPEPEPEKPSTTL